MAHLLYYRKEKVEFEQAYKDIISDSLASLYFDRLKRHYKLSQRLRYHGNRGGGHCNSYEIRLSHNPSIGLLAHELAHAVMLKKTPSMANMRWHCKKHTNIMKRIITFITSHRRDWEAIEESKYAKSTERALLKEKKLQENELLKKQPSFILDGLRKREGKLLSKIKRLNTLLKKVQRRIKYYEKKN